MLIQILSGTPVWVWGILLTLLVLGFKASAARRMSRSRLIVLPIALSAWAASSVWGVGHTAWPVALFVLALAAALALFATLSSQQAAAPHPAGGLQVPGSWLPFTVMMAIFVLRYVSNVTLAIEPSVAHNSAFLTVVALANGAFSGWLAGRSLRLAGVLQATMPRIFTKLNRRF